MKKNIPEGFKAGTFGTLRHEASKLEFEGPRYPTLPLLGHGELWHTGWDIPTRWAIDSDHQAWMDNAHGHPLVPVDANTLLVDAEEDEDRTYLRGLLGLPPVLSPMDVLHAQVKELLMSLSSEEATEILGIPLDTFKGWLKEGIFPGAIQTPLGYWRIPHKEVQAVRIARGEKQ